MKRPWSISTTVRNPERLRNFLKTLSELEGTRFDTENQIKYQTLLIKNKLYKPMTLTRVEEEKFLSDDPFSFEEAKRIFENQNYEDPPMRGRQSTAPLNKMGLCIARQSAETIQITELGRYFLDPETAMSELFFNHFLKWQLPNPDTNQFTTRNGFAIKPFIGTLHFIKKVNKKWKELGNEPVGISKQEFSLFVPTLINYQNIEDHAGKLVEFRLESRANPDSIDELKTNFLRSFLETRDSEVTDRLLQTLDDYGDNTLRYFRLTGYLHIRGNGNYVDLEPRRTLEIQSLLEGDDASPLEFRDADQYREYLADIALPELPWEKKSKLQEIYYFLKLQIIEKNSELEQLGVTRSFPYSFKTNEELDNLYKDELILEVQRQRTHILLLEKEKKGYVMNNPEEICNCINALTNIYNSQKKFSIELERLTALALVAINDALNVKPNYPVGDDGEPTFTAPAGVADIECYYDKFNLVCEVTMLKTRDQWINEGQPVMRHLRQFEDENTDKESYCLFIAPKLHQDTISTFWNSVKHGYRGQNQKIIPLSISQFVKILTIMKEYLLSKGKKLSHSSFLELYKEIIDLSQSLDSEDEWIRQIPTKIEEWKEKVLS